MKTQLSNQASMVNAHIATRILDEAGFKEQINRLLEKDYVTAQMELSAYIRGNFNCIADVEGIAAELINAWLESSEGEVAVKAEELVRRSRSAFAVGVIAFSGAVMVTALMISSIIDKIVSLMFGGLF